MKKLIAMILLCAVLLLGTTVSLGGIAAKNAQAAHLDLMQTLLPGSETFTIETYAGEDANIRCIHKAANGFVIETTTQGYAGPITMLIGVSNEGKVTGLVVRDMSETFGLGLEALTDHVFLAQFLNTGGNLAIGTPGADAFTGATSESTTEAEIYVDAITGATVTSKAITRCVNSAVAYVTGVDASTGATS